MGEECADFWNDIYKNQVRKTDKEARVELIEIGMSLSFYVRRGGVGGMFEPVGTQVSGKSYWGSVKVEIHSYYFHGL